MRTGSGVAYRRALVFAALSALAALAAAGPAGCVLFVPDESFGRDPGDDASASTSDGAVAAGHDAAGSDGAVSAGHDAAGSDGAVPLSDTGGGSDGKASTRSCKLVPGSAKCTCDQLSAPNSVQCTLDTFGDRTNTLCYQGSGTCECAHMGCHSQLAGHCTCNLPDDNPGLSTCDQTGMICCVAGFGLCDCSNLDCGGATQVTTCTVGEMVSLLPGQYQLVDHCSD